MRAGAWLALALIGCTRSGGQPDAAVARATGTDAEPPGDAAPDARPEPDASASAPPDPGRPAVGADHACALRDGRVYCWGGNVCGQLGDGTRRARAHARPVPWLRGVVAVGARAD